MNPKRHEEINLLQTEKIKGINLARFVPKVLDAALSACLAAAYKYKRLHRERGKKRDRDRGGKTGPEAIVPEKKKKRHTHEIAPRTRSSNAGQEAKNPDRCTGSNTYRATRRDHGGEAVLFQW
jgi:hypothetical protein